MTQYFRVEINGNAQNCATVISELRRNDWNLEIDQHGYLIVAEHEWDRLVNLAAMHECEIESLGQYQQAA